MWENSSKDLKESRGNRRRKKVRRRKEKEDVCEIVGGGRTCFVKISHKSRTKGSKDRFLRKEVRKKAGMVWKRNRKILLWWEGALIRRERKDNLRKLG